MSTILECPVSRLLRDEVEYDAAIAEIDRLLDQNVQQGMPEYERLRFLTVLAEAYEEEHYPDDDEQHVTPQDAVNFMLEQKGMTRSDLAPLMGGKGRVSEFFSGKRDLSITQIRVLREVLGIPADLLIVESRKQ